MKKHICIVFLVSLANFALADDEIKTYELEATEITAYEVDNNPETTTISANEMKKSGANNLAQAIKRTPGVFFREATGESATPEIYIRGYSNAQIGVYIDGIPMMSIYGGGADYSAFATSGLAGVQVSKSFANVAFGPNTLGGAINMISSKPEKEFEFGANLNYIGNDGAKGKETQQSISVGTNQGKYYFQIDYSTMKRDTYSFSREYKHDYAIRGYEFNAHYKMETIKLKAGIMPNENHEYSLNYILAKGSKGGMSSDPDDKSSPSTYNDRPVIDTQTIYLLGNSFFTSKLDLDSKFFFQNFSDRDWYRNKNGDLNVNPATDFIRTKSIYDDITYGGILTLNYQPAHKAKISLGLNAKYSKHTQFSWDSYRGTSGYVYEYFTKPAQAAEIQASAFAQYAQGFGKFRLILAGSYDKVDTTNASIEYDYGAYKGVMDRKISPKTYFSWQSVLYYDFARGQSVHFNVGQKHRMPTLRQRYSSETAEYAPNPDLKPESALNYELGYDLNLASTKVSVAVFYNDLKNMFDSSGTFTADRSLCPAPTASGGCMMIGNSDEGHSYGGEVAVEQGFFSDDALVIGANYNYIEKYDTSKNDYNLEGTSRKITDYPNHIVQGKIAVKPVKDLEITGFATYESAPLYQRRQVRRGSSQTIGYQYDRFKDNEFVNFDIMANYNVGKGFSVNAGVYNLMDRDNYVIEQERSFATNGYDWEDNIGTRRLKFKHLSGRRYVVGFGYRY